MDLYYHNKTIKKRLIQIQLKKLFIFTNASVVVDNFHQLGGAVGGGGFSCEALSSGFWESTAGEFDRLENVLALVFFLCEHLSKVAAKLNGAFCRVVDYAERGNNFLGRDI